MVATCTEIWTLPESKSRKHCSRCRQAFPSCDDHLTCARNVVSQQGPGGSSGSLSEMPGQKLQGEELSTVRALFPHCRHGWRLLLPTRTGYQRLVPFADSDIRDLDFDSVNVETYKRCRFIRDQARPHPPLWDWSRPRPWIFWSLRRNVIHC